MVPRPAQFRVTGRTLDVKTPVPIYFEQRNSVIGEIVDTCSEMSRSTGKTIIERSDGSTKECHPFGISLTLRQNHATSVADEYQLVIDDGGVQITAASPAGLFYGMQSFMQLLPTGAGHLDTITLPGLEITDRPRFGWRGMHLDVSRHFFPVAFIKKYIDLLARHKMNIFHWHLTDDQGWRIEINRYPALTDKGAWRTGNDGRRYGGFYTQAEIRTIVEYARQRFVTIVPEIEMPGHARAALAAYPHLSCTGGPFTVATEWGVFEDVYCPGREETFPFLEDVLDEVIALFPSAYVHIGGDECPTTRWQNHDLCRARLRHLGLDNADRLQAYFTARMGKFLAGRGRRMIGWDEILQEGIPSNSIIMAWRSIEKGIEAASAGHDVVMTPMSCCYFDHYQGKANEPKAIGGFTPLETVCAFEPVPQGLPPELVHHVLGAQGNVWTEYMTDTRHVEYMVFPRLCALAEVVWSPPETRSLTDFLGRLAIHLRRLEELHVNYRQLSD